MSTNDSFIKQWSKTPASNGVAPNIVPYGWPEGQPPSSVNNVARQQMTDHRYQWEDAEWFCRGEGSALSKASATSFKITGDVTTDYHEDRRIKIFDTSTKYATITSSNYSAPDTTINLLFDNNDTLGSSLTAVALSILSADHTALPRSNVLNRNVIIGGNFDTNPWQRQVTFTSPTTGTYTADRFVWVFVGAGAVTVQKTADAPTATQAGMFTSNCLDISTTTADASIAATDNYSLKYRVEGYDFAQIAQQPMTISFWVKATITGTYCISFTNSGSDQYYIAEYSVIASNTWEYKTITIPASPSGGTWNYTTGGGLEIAWTIAAGSNFQGTAAAWTNSAAKTCTTNQVNGMNSNANHFKLQLIQLEQGSDASTFEIEPISRTLAKCQRYYEKSYENATYAAAGSAVGYLFFGGASTVTGSLIRTSWTFKVNKRVTPTVTIYSYTNGTSGNVSQDNLTDKAVSTNTPAETGFFIDFTNGAGRYGGLFHFVATSEL